jgi:MFS family permease
LETDQEQSGTLEVQRSQIRFLFLNVGHFLDHLVVLVFATVAALRLTQEWGLSYDSLAPYATPLLIAFGLCAIPAGWLADRWSREGMMVIFFVGIGASCLLAGMANNPVQLSLCLTLLGMFAAIYHPVGLAMVVQGRTKTGVALAINGVFGNMGVACAALMSGFLIDTAGWRSAFFVPGAICVVIGGLYLLFIRSDGAPAMAEQPGRPAIGTADPPPISRDRMVRLIGIIFFTTAIGGLIFQSTTFALPKIFDERLTDLAGTATLVGWYAFIVFSVAAMAQLVVGYLLDTQSLRTVFAVVAIAQAVLFSIMTHLSGVASLLVAIGFMLAVFGQIPINDVLVGRLARSEWRSRAFALRYIVTFTVSASAVPLIAWIHGAWGFSMLFRLLSAAAALIFLAVMLLPKADEALRRKNTLEHEEERRGEEPASRKSNDPGRKNSADNPQIKRREPTRQTDSHNRADCDMRGGDRHTSARREDDSNSRRHRGTKAAGRCQRGDLAANGLHNTVTVCGQTQHDTGATERQNPKRIPRHRILPAHIRQP